jgi:hypothetical protein
MSGLEAELSPARKEDRRAHEPQKRLTAIAADGGRLRRGKRL